MLLFLFQNGDRTKKQKRFWHTASMAASSSSATLPAAESAAEGSSLSRSRAKSMFVDASHSRSIAGLKRQNTFSMGQVGAALVKGDNAIDTPPKRVAKDLLSALTGGRKEAGSPVPRTAKGSSSIQQLRDVSEIAPSAKLMRYSVVGEMKLYQKIWMTLDDPCYAYHYTEPHPVNCARTLKRRRAPASYVKYHKSPHSFNREHEVLREMAGRGELALVP